MYIASDYEQLGIYMPGPQSNPSLIFRHDSQVRHPYWRSDS